MERQAFWRGLGIGLILGGLVLFFTRNNLQISQADLIERARSLGMITKQEAAEQLARELAQARQEWEKQKPSQPQSAQPQLQPATERLVLVVLPKGVTSEKIADILLAEGLIRDKKAFLAEVDKARLARKFKAGTYQIKSNATIAEILAILTR